jgi:hypothetical protein
MARFARYASPLPRENTDVCQRRFRAHSSSCSHLKVWRFTGKQFVHRVQRHVSIYYHRFGCFNQVGLSVTLSGILAAAAKIHRGPPSPQLHLSCVSRPCHRCKNLTGRSTWTPTAAMPSAFYWPLLVPCAPAGLRRQLTNSLGSRKTVVTAIRQPLPSNSRSYFNDWNPHYS